MASSAIFDLLRKNPNFGSQAFSSLGLFSGGFAGASSAVVATSFAAATPFAFRSIFGDVATHVSYCDAGAILDEDFSSSMPTASGNKYVGAILGEDYPSSIGAGNIFQNDMKQYDIQLKPLLSAFHWKNFALTSLRSFAQFYLPLLEPRPPMEEDDDDFLDQEEHHVDLVEPFKKSVKQIARETSVTTTRRILERLAVHYTSQRMASKLLKDVPKSAIRKAGRGLPTCTFCFCISRTTFRGHLLGVVASWAVQVGIDIYRFFFGKEDNVAFDRAERVRIIGKKVFGTTARCAGSLVFASIGAGIGAVLIKPSTGQWIGCVLGDFAGPFIVGLCFQKFNLDIGN